MNRNIIFVLQYELPNFNIHSKDFFEEYGILHEDFFKEHMRFRHPFHLARFNNYMERILHNIKVIQKLQRNNKTKIHHIKISNKPYGKYTLCTVSILSTDCMWGMQAGYEYWIDGNNNPRIYRKKTDEGTYTYLYNFSNINCRIDTLQKLSNILSVLDKLKKSNTNNDNDNEKKEKKDKMIYNILYFYYMLIVLMPFIRGTASIAEIMLHSMYQYYIGKEIIINPKIMLDIEVFMYPFIIFFKNCTTSKSNGDIYTPYLTEK